MEIQNTGLQQYFNFDNSLSSEARFFLEPEQPKQRQYEALRAYFVENLPAKDVAARLAILLALSMFYAINSEKILSENIFSRPNEDQNTAQSEIAHENA